MGSKSCLVSGNTGGKPRVQDSCSTESACTRLPRGRRGREACWMRRVSRNGERWNGRRSACCESATSTPRRGHGSSEHASLTTTLGILAECLAVTCDGARGFVVDRASSRARRFGDLGEARHIRADRDATSEAWQRPWRAARRRPEPMAAARNTIVASSAWSVRGDADRRLPRACSRPEASMVGVRTKELHSPQSRVALRRELLCPCLESQGRDPPSRAWLPAPHRMHRCSAGPGVEPPVRKDKLAAARCIPPI